MRGLLVLLTPLGYLLLLFAGCALAGALTAGLYCEWGPLAVFSGLGGGAALLGGLAHRLRPDRQLSADEALPLTAFGYLLFSLLGAIPFLGAGSFLDGWFEAMSGITTTGLSVFVPESLPRSLVLFRALYQWVGGAGIVVISLALLRPPGRTALALYGAEYGQQNLAGNVRHTARRVAFVYLSLTAAGLVTFWAVGMTPFDAVCHVLATLSTGGFSPHSGSIGHYTSPALQAAVTVFMLCGAVSLPLFWLVGVGKARRTLGDRQLWALVATSLLIGGLVAGVLGSAGAGLFQGVSAVTTTGFSSVPTQELPGAARWALILGMVAGGCGGSTAGGIKLFRLLAMLAMVRWLFSRARLPQEAQVPFRIAGERFAGDEVQGIAAYVITYLGVLVAATLALVYSGYDLSAALFEAASAQGTVGLSVGVTSGAAPVGVKLLLVSLMWMGRLEVVPVILLLRRLGGRR
ncbi:MAG: TrkH family potassium uptake protein [Candidatus Bipolaricaulaceae bacterium]